MLNPNFVIAGSLIFLGGSASYLIDTLKGKVRPNKVTWFLWGFAPLIAFAAEITQGVGIASLLTFTVGFVPLIVFLASFVNRKSYWKINKLDIGCGVFSVIGLVLWYTTKVGNIAIGFSILADFLAAVPTLVKSYNQPETENYLLFLTNAISAGITLLTIKVWSFATFAFPLYIFLITSVFAILIKFKIGKLLRYSPGRLR